MWILITLDAFMEWLPVNTDFISIGVVAVLFLLFFFYASIISFFEGKADAGKRFLITGLIIPAALFLLIYLDYPLKSYTLFFVMVLILISVLLFFLPLRFHNQKVPGVPVQRIDERDTMFSRNKLIPGSQRFHKYYSKHPDKLKMDNQFRELPGLLKEGTLFYNPYMFSSAAAGFFVVESLKPIVDGKTNSKPVKTDRKQITAYIKNWLKKLGALDAGITELKDYHLYSYGGRDERYDKKVETDHKYAIAFTVEMDYNMTQAAPDSSIVMESAQQYLSSGVIATQLAAFIRNLGYSARAHIDGNYQVVCPLVARDAGLGEIGRMGLLMTPRQGPRVRINVVTTDLELITDQPEKMNTLIDFCEKCKKCAECCPARAIPFDSRKLIDGTLRWQTDQEKCFTFWCRSGTDCGRCISVCPYSHPDNLLHRLVRSGIKNNIFFSRLALAMDDFFYGKKPASGKLPGWLLK